MSTWKQVWNKNRGSIDKMTRSDARAMLLALKKLNGFDILAEGISYEAFLKRYEAIKQVLQIPAGGSVFEVGCGAGANLWLFQQDGFRVGGIDFSTDLLSTFTNVFDDGALLEVICDEACSLPQEKTYDAVFSDGVFHYFPDLAYAKEVMEAMLAKTRGSIAILDVHDAAKKAAFFAFRKQLDPDYDVHYQGLDKLFFEKSFFEMFAKEHDIAVSFVPTTLEGYWNEPFTYSVFFSKHC